MDISYQVSPSFTSGCLYWSARELWVDESGMIRTQIRAHSRSENGRSTWDALYDTTL
jgi:hypothetical protein